MSSSSSRIARLKYVFNRNHVQRKASNKFKKSVGNLMAYGARTNTYYNQNQIKHCPDDCPEDAAENEEEEDTSGNVILKISPATEEEKKRNSNIKSSLGILIPKYSDASKTTVNEYFNPYKYYTLIHNLIFKTTLRKVKIIDYNRDYVALPPGQIGWDDKLYWYSQGYLYYYVILSNGLKSYPTNKYIPLVYLDAAESDNFKLVDTVPVINNKTPDNIYTTKVRLLVADTDTDDTDDYKKIDISGSALDI